VKEEGLHKLQLLPPSKNNPRNSEGSIIRLADGRLFLAYTHFYGGPMDYSPAYIAGRYSDDGGRTWSEDCTVVENEGNENVMSVSLLRLASGEIGLFYLLKNSWEDCRCQMRKSDDETKSWSDRVSVTEPVAYYVVNNDRVIQLSSGRLLVPASRHPKKDERSFRPGTAMCFMSDDGGTTWTKSSTEIAPPPDSRSGLQEPGIVELKDGSVMMLCRTDRGCHYRSYSTDGGVTWSPAEPTDIIAPCSPATVKRIPTTGDLLLIWNDHSGEYARFEHKRTPLTSAISRDEGRTWENTKIIEDDPDGWYCYTSVCFNGNEAVMAYCAGNSKIGGLNLLQITICDIGWFYE